MKQYIDEPPSFEEGKIAADFIRRRVIQKPSYDITSDSDVGDSDSSSQPDKPRKRTKKRKRREVDDAELEARREKRRLADMEKRAMIKSAVRIIDSDDDEEADEEFFERERELRMRMEHRAMAGDLPSPGTKKVGKKTGKKKHPAPPQQDAWVVDSSKEASVSTDIVTLQSENDADGNLGTNEDESDSGDIEAVRSSKRRMVRALSISSDEE